MEKSNTLFIRIIRNDKGLNRLGLFDENGKEIFIDYQSLMLDIKPLASRKTEE